MDTPRTTLQLDRHGAAAVLTLDRPAHLNAIDAIMLDELEAVFTELSATDDVKVVVVTGAGRAFCAGVDVRNFGPAMAEAASSAHAGLRFQVRMAALPQALRALPQPVVAAVNGVAVGGGMALCLAADIRICSESARFANAAIKLGLSGAEMGMSYLLPKVVGASVAADWMLTGRTVTADEAVRVGLVSACVEDAAMLPHALDLAAQVAEHSSLALEMTKRALHFNADAADLAAAIELENRNQVIAYGTDEAAAARAKWSQR